MKKLAPLLLCLALLLFSCIHAFPQQGRWDILKTYNEVPGRSECGMAACNGKLYILGGDKMNPVDVFDPKTMHWTKKSGPPVPMNHFEAVSLEDKIYVLEAFEGGSYPNQTNLANVYIYNTQSDTWQKGMGLTPERRRAAAGAAEYDGKLYLVAGIKNGHVSGTTNLFDMYDPVTDRWTALPDAPHSRDHCEAAVAGDKLYVAGGRNTSYRDPKNITNFFSQTVLEVDCYDFKTGKWSTLAAKLPMGTGGGAMVNLNGILYYIGGERATPTEQNAPRKNTFYLNTAYPEKWHETDSLKMPRNGMCAAVLNNRIFVFGGADGFGAPVNSANSVAANSPAVNPNVPAIPVQTPPADSSPLEVYTMYSELVELL